MEGHITPLLCGTDHVGGAHRTPHHVLQFAVPAGGRVGLVPISVDQVCTFCHRPR